MADELPPRLMNLSATDADTGEEKVIGRVALDAAGQLKLLAAAPDRKGFLANVVRGVNEKAVFHVRIAPKDSSPESSIATRDVRRTDEDFVDALQGYLRKYYQLSLAD